MIFRLMNDIPRILRGEVAAKGKVDRGPIMHRQNYVSEEFGYVLTRPTHALF